MRAAELPLRRLGVDVDDDVGDDVGDGRLRVYALRAAELPLKRLGVDVDSGDDDDDGYDVDDDRLRTIAIGITFLPFVTLLPLSVMLTIPLLSCWACFSICHANHNAFGHAELGSASVIQ